MVWKPSVTVAAVIERDGRFLFVEEKIDGEVMEETAHHFEPAGLVGVYRWHYAAKDVTFLRFCFFGHPGDAEQRALDKGIVRVHWLTPRELQQRKSEHRSPLVQKCVDDYLAGRRVPLDIFSPEFA
jgi:hypothetical protein